jgi:UrcA family protein
MYKFFISGFAAASLAVAVPAHSSEVAVHVNHADLDLSRAKDVAKLRKRVRSAVKNACSTGMTSVSYVSIQTCIGEAMAEADLQIREKRMTAVAMADG